MIKVVHVKKAPYDVYIGRANGDLPKSKWANPWVIGKDGTREEVIAKYAAWIKTQPDLMTALPELRDKTLACWCAPDHDCHGNVLARLVEEMDAKPTVLPIFTSHYSYTQSILTLEEAGKTALGNPVSIVDLARQHHLKQVVLVDERMDGVLEAYKNLSKSFKPTPPKTLADYLKDEMKDKKSANDADKAAAQTTFDEATAKYEREKAWSTEPIQLVFGLKLAIVPDMTVKTPESEVNESSVIVFMRDAAPTKGVSSSYTDLLKINNRAWTTGRYDHGRLDWKTLKELWTPNLTLALPFFSSFIARNTLTMASITPELPCVPWVFKEVDSQLPFAPLIDEAIDRYIVTNPAPVQPVKSIYYAGQSGSTFEDYTIFRARSTRSKGKSGTFSAPGVDNMASDRFSFAAWKELAV